jgi:hypothetical protein
MPSTVYLPYHPFPLFVPHKKSSLNEKPRELREKGDKTKFNNLIIKVMHSRIFQITQTRVEKENYLNEDTLMQGDNSHFDYCAEIDDEERKENIEYLVNHILPKDRVTRHKSGWLYLILARAAPVSFIAMSCRTSVAGFFAFLPVPYPRSNGMTPLLLVPALQVVSTGGNTVRHSFISA